MKLIIVFLVLNFSVYSQSNEELMKKLESLQQRIDHLEGKKKKKGLKTTDFGGKSTSNPTMQNSSGKAPAATPEQMKQIMDALKKGDKYIKDRDKLLKELDEEGL